MTHDFAQRFMNQLQETERTGDVGSLVDLFGAEAELRRLDDEAVTGHDGARTFWREYLSAFDKVRTTFTNVYVDGDAIVMEWVSEAQPATADGFQYEGVTILEVIDGKIKALRTYYDTARFVETQAGT